jgi:xylulokinase
LTEVTVGIDIGTTSVKAVAADGDGNVVARCRVPHRLRVPAPDELEHDIDEAWRAGVVTAYADVGRDLDVRGAQVAAMVPSLGAVRADGSAAGPGLLYGDHRGRAPVAATDRDDANPAASGELYNFLKWLVKAVPDAAGYWPAQAAGNHALCGRAAIDTVTAMTAMPLFDFTSWDADLAAEAGTDVSKLPDIVPGSDPVGLIRGTNVPLGGGAIDAFAEQLVAGADAPGDVLVICGTTLITWAVIEEWREVPGLWTIPHTAPGGILVGGPSNAGGLFLDWARRLLPETDAAASSLDPGRVPVWLPYVRGERTPLHDPVRRASLHDLDLTHCPAAVRRAAYEAAGFVVRHHLDLAGVAAQRLVATGGGVRVAEWVQCLADCTGLPVDVVAVPEGGALGAAFLARVTAGLESTAARSSRWARYDRRVEPDDAWAAAVAARYERFRELTAASP